MATDVLTRPAKAKRAPERSALAEAIDARNASAERLRVAHEAHAEIERKFEGTRTKHYEADTALDEARTFLADALRMHGGDEAAAVAHALKIGRDPPRQAVATAEREYQRTKEALDLGQQGRNAAKGGKLAADDDLAYFQRKVVEAAEKVCYVRLPELVKRVESARADYVAAKSILSLLSERYDGVHQNYAITNDPLAKRIRSLVYFEANMTVDFQGVVQEASAPWRAAYQALLVNADAELPEV